ncbi:MAG: hypothetical protein Q4A55_02815 [Aerococcus sp.]|nr:hypothetical protein [Aerococcus sp.]
MSKKDPLVTRESYRHEREKSQWQGKLRQALGWDSGTKKSKDRPAVSQTTQMFSLNPDDLPKRKSSTNASSTKQSAKSTARTQSRTSNQQSQQSQANQAHSANRRRHATSATQAGERVTSQANQSQIEVSSFWTIKKGKVDRFLNWGIGLSLLGIILVTLIALFV